MTEPDVALTDYVLALECAFFCWVLISNRRRASALRNWFSLMFFGLALAPALGGTVHGFFLDERSLGYRLLWPATLICTGLISLSIWIAGAILLLKPKWQRLVMWAAAAEFLSYGALVVWGFQSFSLVIAQYLPATVFLALGILLIFFRTRKKRVLCGLVGLIFIFIAAGVQVFKIAPHPVYLNHNSFYHLIQAFGLALVFVAALDLIEQKETEDARN